MFVIAGVFLLSAFSGFASGNAVGGVGCIVIAAVLAFLGYRSKDTKTDAPAAPVSPQPVPAEKPKKEFYSFKLAGVTFNNDDGTSRQSVLRAINFKDAPFTNGAELELNSYTYDGQPAYAVLANGKQLGNVPRDSVQFITDNFSRIEAITNISVYGGGRGSDGTPISYGAEITIRLNVI